MDTMGAKQAMQLMRMTVRLQAGVASAAQRK
jgi:hypothetical protein